MQHLVCLNCIFENIKTNLGQFSVAFVFTFMYNNYINFIN